MDPLIAAIDRCILAAYALADAIDHAEEVPAVREIRKDLPRATAVAAQRAWAQAEEQGKVYRLSRAQHEVMLAFVDESRISGGGFQIAGQTFTAAR